MRHPPFFEEMIKLQTIYMETSFSRSPFVARVITKILSIIITSDEYSLGKIRNKINTSDLK